MFFFCDKKQNSTKVFFTVHAILENETDGFEPHLCYPRCDNRLDERFHFYVLLC